jgi:hypothetical protein
MKKQLLQTSKSRWITLLASIPIVLISLVLQSPKILNAYDNGLHKSHCNKHSFSITFVDEHVKDVPKKSNG